MIIRKLDASGDWTFGKGLSNYATGEQAIEENIATRIKSWVGDCFFATEDFIDWKSRLDAGQQANLVAELKTNIMQAFGVMGINSFAFSFDPILRRITITYNIVTIFSQSFQRQLQVAAGTAGS